jgi:ADP-heptose:LPS heptosyltransferase
MALSTVHRVLIYRLGSLGDTVVALPCLHLVARTWPQAERRLLTNIPVHDKAPLSAAVLGISPPGSAGLIHGTMNYPVGTRSLSGLLQLRKEIRAYRPDVLVYLGPVRGIRAAQRDALFFRLCGIRTIVGLPNTEDLQKLRTLTEVEGYVRPEAPDVSLKLSPDIGLPVTELREPEAFRLARCLAPLGDARVQDAASWDLLLTEAERQRALEVLEPVRDHPILAAAIGTKVQAKDWGTANWASLLTTLTSELPRHRIVLVGAPQEATESDEVSAAWGERALNLCGQLTPRETAAVLGHAQLFLGLDSGPMHLAATVGTPIVAIFAARNTPVHWFPFGTQHRVLYHRTDCWGCGLETCVAERKKCLTSITVEEVLAAIRKSLASISAGPTRP